MAIGSLQDLINGINTVNVKLSPQGTKDMAVEFTVTYNFNEFGHFVLAEESTDEETILALKVGLSKFIKSWTLKQDSTELSPMADISTTLNTLCAFYVFEIFKSMRKAYFVDKGE